MIDSLRLTTKWTKIEFIHIFKKNTVCIEFRTESVTLCVYFSSVLFMIKLECRCCTNLHGQTLLIDWSVQRQKYWEKKIYIFTAQNNRETYIQFSLCTHTSANRWKTPYIQSNIKPKDTECAHTPNTMANVYSCVCVLCICACGCLLMNWYCKFKERWTNNRIRDISNGSFYSIKMLL